MQIIHVQWGGPFTLDDVKGLSDESCDYGLYQVYGHHPVYGREALQYIGKAEDRTFAKRIPEHEWDREEQPFTFYVGRMAGCEQPTDDEWGRQIGLAERLLISAHSPAGNSSGLQSEPGKEFHDVHVLNWGHHAALLPEVSGLRYSTRCNALDGYATFVYRKAKPS